jgi:predicted SprT family Zn-dependent metalloprotease
MPQGAYDNGYFWWFALSFMGLISVVQLLIVTVAGCSQFWEDVPIAGSASPSEEEAHHRLQRLPIRVHGPRRLEALRQGQPGCVDGQPGDDEVRQRAGVEHRSAQQVDRAGTEHDRGLPRPQLGVHEDGRRGVAAGLGDGPFQPGHLVGQLAADCFAVWASLWQVPELAAAPVRVSVSRSMHHSLGRWLPARCEIRVSILALCSTAVVVEVLCHEAAHVAVFLRHGSKSRPHGPEWRALMQEAGFGARTRIPLPSAAAPAQRISKARVYEHRCPICQSVSYARRPMPRLRCTTCCAAGLDGILEIVRVKGA